MTLGEWLKLPGNNKRKLAMAARVEWKVIHKIAEGGHVPRANTAKKIEEATGGEVTAAEILGLTKEPVGNEAA